MKLRREPVINNELTSVNYESFENVIVNPHGKKCHSPTCQISLGRATCCVAYLFRTESKTDDFFNINIRCVLLVNRFVKPTA